MDLNAADLSRLTEELLRVTTSKIFCGKFESEEGVVEGATETDVVKHLTSSRDYADGRQYRFPGIAGWGFESVLAEAGFRIVTARNHRGQQCRVVTL